MVHVQELKHLCAYGYQLVEIMAPMVVAGVDEISGRRGEGGASWGHVSTPTPRRLRAVPTIVLDSSTSSESDALAPAF